jgi:aldehyde dehydrogenase (NAD+)
VHEAIKDDFVAALEKAITNLHTENPQKSSAYGRIVNQRHHERLCELLKPHKEGLPGKLIGGQSDPSTLYLAPTIISFDDLDTGSQASVMASEIFGPILPILPVKNVDEAISFVNSRYGHCSRN